MPRTELVIRFDCDTDLAAAELATEAASYLKALPGHGGAAVKEHKQRATSMSVVDAIRIVADHPESLSIVASLIAYLVGRGSGKTKLTIFADGTVVADGITSNTAEAAIKAHYERGESAARQ